MPPGGFLDGVHLNAVNICDMKSDNRLPTQEECDRIENVTDDQLESQLMDAKTVPNPCKETIYRRHK